MIAQQVKILGTVRTFDEVERAYIKSKIEKCLQGVCIANEGTFDYKYVYGYAPVVNDEEQAKFILEAAKNVEETIETIEMKPMMIGEDFGYYLQKVPGAFFFVGAKPSEGEQVYPHHHPRFNFNERAMLHIAKIMIMAIVNYE